MIQDQMNSKKNFFKTFLNLIKDSRPNKFLFFILLISFILIPSSITSLGVLIKNFIDNAFQQNQGTYEKIRLFSYLNQYTIYFICLSIILAFASSLRIFAINYLNDFLALRIKERIFKKILNFDLKTYDQYGKNFFKTLLGFEIEEVISAVNLKLSLIARNIGLFIGSISLLFFSNLKLSLIIILSILFVLFFISIMGIRLRKSIKLMKEMKNKTFLYIDESITFIKLIKIFNQNQRQLENLTDEHKKILQNVFWVYIFRGIFIGFIIICLFFTIILTIYFGSMMILNGEMTPGTLSSFIFYALISSTSLGGIIESFFEISKYRLNFDKIQNILECNNDKNESGSQIIEKFQSLEFKNIYFGYNNENCFLKDLNFRVKNKEKISIIGPSGSGKSTILNLIFGFFKPNSGSILINDINLSNINLESYYKKLSILSQEVEIFSISLFENFTYGCDNFDEKFLWHLIEIFNLKDFIQKLKDGIHTRIGDEEGAKLSGGQKQRVGLIRALLRKPEILILDEFTSSLDSQNEANIYEFLLSKECENICVIFVTHKLFYLDKMNKIIKLSNSGEIEIISNQ